MTFDEQCRRFLSHGCDFAGHNFSPGTGSGSGEAMGSGGGGDGFGGYFPHYARRDGVGTGVGGGCKGQHGEFEFLGELGSIYGRRVWEFNDDLRCFALIILGIKGPVAIAARLDEDLSLTPIWIGKTGRDFCISENIAEISPFLKGRTS